jgi:hypothetical protein
MKQLISGHMETIWTTIVLSSCIVSWTAQAILYKKIKEKYYHKWIAIGEPGFQTMISLNMSKFKKARLTRRYFLKGDEELDADKQIKRLKIINQFIFLASVTLVIAFFVLSFFIPS